ncbi:hypothetical protein [Acaryochloris sp. IP29b_bin.137]|uniref:hypothetical protein n=1 Tax=Acaryochloris sp. IP29b_bin.137 TaxID=2969217 RepID=UPI0026090D2F|nr:hypothetical protein [Acaryochloris sp. IP29b_bin.137]
MSPWINRPPNTFKLSQRRSARLDPHKGYASLQAQGRPIGPQSFCDDWRLPPNNGIRYSIGWLQRSSLDPGLLRHHIIYIEQGSCGGLRSNRVLVARILS